MADDVVANVNGLLDVVGLSLGGMVAQHLGLRHPARVRSLLLACTTAHPSPSTMLQRARDVDEVGIHGVLQETLGRWFTVTALRDNSHPGVAYVRRRLLQDNPETFADSWRAMARHDLIYDISRFLVPVTLIAGDQDVSTPVGVLKQLADRIPNSRLEVMSGPHMLPLECPEQFAASIASHLNWVSSAVQ
jgi:pimeloyl-ACP methyl ester carboxylesterase